MDVFAQRLAVPRWPVTAGGEARFPNHSLQTHYVMSNSANVHSSEAIESVRAGLLSFIEQVSDSIVTLDLEMRRVLEWVEHDRPRHWKNQNRLGMERLNEAQAALHQCLMYPKTVNDRPTCYEERQAVKMAQARVEYCQRKAERVRHWKRILPHEVSEYKGRISRLKRLVEVELPTAVGILEKILLRLAEYTALKVEPAAGTYQDFALVQEIWPEKKPGDKDAVAAETINPDGEPASAGGSQPQES
jgi:hypothetical protein